MSWFPFSFHSKHPDKKIWFKAKEYGLGWYPATWQGYAVLVSYLLVVLVSAWGIFSGRLVGVSGVKRFIFAVGLFTLFLLYISYTHGDPLKWRWGKRKDTEHDENTLY